MIKHLLLSKIDVSVFQCAKNNNTHCGDSYFIHETDDYFICAVADGLGSGKDAELASATAVSVVEQFQHECVGTIMELCNQRLCNGRGAVLSILKIDYKQHRLSYANIGNIRFIVYSPSGVLARPVPRSGFLCGRKIKCHEQHFNYDPHSSFVLYTDGFRLPSNDHYIPQMNSSKESVEYLVKKNDELNDDATLLIGKLF